MTEPLADLRSPYAPSFLSRGLMRRLCTGNPFYVVSAGLVLFGLRMSFDPGAKVFPAWAFLLR